MFQIKIDSRQLDAFADKLAQAAGKVKPIIVEQLAHESFNLTQDGFKKEKDPYGKKWQPRQTKADRAANRLFANAADKIVSASRRKKDKPKPKKKPKPKPAPKAKKRKPPKAKPKKNKSTKGVGVSPVLGIGGGDSATVGGKKKKGALDEWKAHKRKKGRKKKAKRRALLVATGLMRNSANVSSAGSVFTLGFERPYATYHQSGTAHMPARMLVPTSGRGLPKKWKNEFRHVIQDVLAEYFNG